MNNNSITIGGNNAGVVAVGNSNCNISNSVSISSDPATKQLEELLLQLRKHIQDDVTLSSGDKQDLLEETNALAKAKQLPAPAEKEKVARKARKMFDATLKALPATATLVESCNKILPVIFKLIGVQMP